MRIVVPAIIVTTGVVGLIGSALAADMTAAEIKAELIELREKEFQLQRMDEGQVL
jgi:hypothetical protein